MKNLIYLPIVLLCLTSTVNAATIHLKNGKAVTGTILEQNDKNVKVSVDGTTMTYYADEVQDIDGVALAQAPKAQPLTGVIQPVASVPGAKRDLILKFIEVFGTKDAMAKNLEAMMQSLPADDPQSQKIKNNIKVDEIIEQLIPLYDKQFSEADLKGFIDFYSSPQGRKLVQSIPEIMRGSVEVSAKYFQEKFPELQEKQ
jgi:uncharacterized protein